MSSALKELFLKLVRLGIGFTDFIDNIEFSRLSAEDWELVKALADQQGLTSVVLDGLDRLLRQSAPVDMPVMQKKQWIGQMLRKEQEYSVQRKSAADMAALLQRNGIKTYVLKGEVVSECYPKPSHRFSVDMDCFLLSENGTEDVWEKGNRLVEEEGYRVARGFYKNSTFHLPWLTVENHKFLTPFRGNARLKQLEKLLQAKLAEDAGEDRFEGTYLYRPPLMVSALFLIEHAYSHFLHEGLTWRHILDWAMFSRRHQPEMDWTAFDTSINAFGFRKFYESYVRMGRFLLGELSEEALTAKDKMMMADVWAPLDLHETRHGVKGKLALAGNTWRARWKYRHFAEISMPHALWIQVKGFLFMKNPTLE